MLTNKERRGGERGVLLQRAGAKLFLFSSVAFPASSGVGAMQEISGLIHNHTRFAFKKINTADAGP